MTQRLRIALVEDHRIFRAGLLAELSDRFDVVGEAGDVARAISMLKATSPDVALLDVHLPSGSGREVLDACLSGGLPTKFLALSVSDAAEDVINIVRGGARGYVTKGISGQELAEAIERVASGDAVFSPRLAGFVLDAFARGTPTEPSELDALSAREREVMRFIARGYTYREVARELSLSPKTIETHVSSVLRKLQVSNRHELTSWARSHGVV
jgi:DNA-binding NarL/FixJ family response regulator